MTPDEITQKLEQYQLEFIEIQRGFIEFGGIPSIRYGDDSRYFTLIITILDLLRDTFGENHYEPIIKKLHNDCITDETLQSPTLQSIEAIISVIKAIITRIKNNPEICAKKEATTNPEPIKPKLQPPEKVTLKWLWEHVPYTLWGLLIGLLISAFTLGVTVADTKIYKSVISLLTPDTSTNKNVPDNK